MGPAQDAALAGHGDMAHGERSVGGRSGQRQLAQSAHDAEASQAGRCSGGSGQVVRR
jgi:hypothetical protein